MEHISLLWSIFVVVFGAAAAWGGAVYAIKTFDKRITRIEEKVDKFVPLASCHDARVECRSTAITGNCQIQQRLDDIFDMFRELEERRNTRWEEFERRRESAKDALQYTLTTMTGQINNLEGIITERSMHYRKTNGV